VPSQQGPEGASLVLQAGEEDPERRDRGERELGSPRLQRSLQALHDRALRADLVERARSAGRRADEVRLQELGDPSVSLEWLWALNHFHGPVLTPTRYADAVRLLLGAAAPTFTTECHLCGKPMEPGGAHGLHCPRREITVRHNALRDAWAPLIAAVDPNLKIEADGLLPQSQRRPTDILTTVTPGGLQAALDFGVASPHASQAGGECILAMVARKERGLSGAEREALQDQNIRYQPIVYSCYGRCLPDTDQLLTFLANAAAIRYGLASSKYLLRRTRARIATAIWNGAAACVGATRRPMGGVEDLICGGDLAGDGRPVETQPVLWGEDRPDPHQA
jgi:hypothetical protein